MMDCNHDFSEGHYCPKCGAFDQDVAQEMADSIAELKTRLESEEAHYTRLAEQLAEVRAEVARLVPFVQLVADALEVETEFETEWGKSARAALAALQEG